MVVSTKLYYEASIYDTSILGKNSPLPVSKASESFYSALNS